MTEELQRTFEKLRALTPKLNTATDEADKLVQRLDRFLTQECQAAVQVEVPVRYNDKGKPILLLRYAHVNGKYRVCLTYSDGDSRFVTRAWCECDRADKLAGFGLLPKLVTAVSKAVEQQLAAATGAAATVNELTKLIGDPPAAAQAKMETDSSSEPVLMLRAG